MNHEV
jgi:hypothetical protein